MARKALGKSKKDKIIFGVVGGVAEYYNIDSTLLRIIWLVIISFTGFVPGIITYIIASFVMP